MTPASAKSEPSELRDTILRAREGNLDAAYAVLAEQVPVDTWVTIISALARKPTEVDLEVVAHRTLRRQPVAVPQAVIHLAQAIGTPQAAFVARSIAELRTEEQLVAEANRLAAELSNTHHPTALLADGRPVEALYALLARPLREASAVWAEIRSDPAREELLDALRSEYERLQELSKDKRWRSGSYRHVLRHALADLALIAKVGGKLEDQAFRLLQQRTENPRANRELLALLPEEARRAYLAWVVDRPSGKEETERTLFALEEIEHRYLGDVARSSIERLLSSKDDEIAIAAAGVLVRTAPDERSGDRSIADLVERLGDHERARLLDGIARDAPSRIRLDLWPPGVDVLLARNGSDAVTQVMAELYEGGTDPQLRSRALTILLDRELDASVRTRLARAAVHRDTQTDSPEIRALLGSPSGTQAVWTALAEGGLTPVPLLELLIDIDGPSEAASRVAAYFEAMTEQHRPRVEAFILDGIEAGTLAVEPISGTSLGGFLGPEAAARTRKLAERRVDLDELVGHGDHAAEVEFARAIAPLVARAIDRSAGNGRLVAAYQRMTIDTPDDTNAPGQASEPFELDPVELDALQAPLAKSGLRLEASARDILVTADSAANAIAQLRALALVDQRVDRGTGNARATAARIRHAVVAALGGSGLAERAMRDVVARGQLAPAVAALSATVRHELFDAAAAEGLVPPDEWGANPMVAQWTMTRSVDTTADTDADPLALLASLQWAALAVRETESRLSAARDAARQAFFSVTERGFADLDDAEDVYVQFWIGLSRVGIERVAVPGSVVDAEEVDAERFEIVGDVRGPRYVVRFGGVVIGDDVIRRARVEAKT